jgi:hypothetical protein
MLIRVASDLHLEFFKGAVAELADHFLSADGRDSESVLVLAGDISSNVPQLAGFLAHVEARFRHVVFVPGNHEYFGHDMDDCNRMLQEGKFQRTTVAAGYVATVQVLGVTFVACTLWASGGASASQRSRVLEVMRDFRHIQRLGEPFTVAYMQALNRSQRYALACALRCTEGPTVVVSHHLPSFKLCHPRFDIACNGGFASNCDDLMHGERAPALWIHGHTHDTIDTAIGRTRVVCNPAGYRPEWGNPFNTYFAAPKFVEVDCGSDAP